MTEGVFTRVRAAIERPFPEPMTWTNTFLIIGFIMVATLMWRQVINYIGLKGE